MLLALAGTMNLRAVSNASGVMNDISTLFIVAPTNAWEIWEGDPAVVQFWVDMMTLHGNGTNWVNLNYTNLVVTNGTTVPVGYPSDRIVVGDANDDWISLFSPNDNAYIGILMGPNNAPRSEGLYYKSGILGIYHQSHTFGSFDQNGIFNLFYGINFPAGGENLLGPSSYPVGYTKSAQIPFVGGSASSMDDLPPSALAVANNMPVPVFKFAANLNDNFSLTNFNQREITNIIPQLAFLEGFLEANGTPSVCTIDSHWTHPNRDTNGFITWDTNAFPKGIPWLAAFLHTNHWNLELDLYYMPVFLNATNIQIVTDSAFYQEMTPMTVQKDIGLIHSWGVDGIRAEDNVLDSGYQQQLMLQVSAACVSPKGLVFNDPINQTYPRPMYSGALIQNPPNPNWSSWLNEVGNDGFEYPPPAAATTWFLIDMWNARVDWTNYVPGTSRGHYFDIGQFSSSVVNYGLPDARIILSSSAMFYSVLGFAGSTNYPFISLSITNSMLSNTNWLAIRNDPLFAHTVKIYDGGILSTSVWARPLASAGAAVWMVNETGVPVTQSIQFSQLGALPTATYDVIDCWSNAVDLGNFTGGFTNTIPAYDCGLYQFKPVATDVSTTGVKVYAHLTNGVATWTSSP